MSNNSRVARRSKRTKQKKTVFKRIMLVLVAVFALMFVAVGSLFTYYIITAPKLDIEKLEVPFASQFYDKDGNLFADRGEDNRIQIEYEDLPDMFIDALTATEDARFFKHRGIDMRRIMGAVIANIKHGFGSEGASTITQQVVENMFLTPDKKLKLKVQEQWLALQLERQYSKEEILEMYLNKIYFGSNAYGVGKAAEVYFGIDDLHDLNLVQAAILAGLPQRPHAYNPFENPDLMQERVNTVLKLMVRHDKISQEQADEAMAVDVASVLTDKKPSTIPYQSFIQQVEKEIDEKLPDVNINSDGVKIYTTLDTDAQKHVEFLLTDSDANPITYPDDDLQAGVTVLDTKSGAIRAIGGSRNSEGNFGFNYAINEGRQGGSTLKPILAYGPAIEFEKWSTYEQLLDEPYTPDGSKEIKNVTGTHKGWVTAREALKDSINVPAAKTLDNIGSDKVKPFGESLGLSFHDGSLDVRDAIGGTKNSISTLTLAGAYSAFGNEGIYNEPYAVTKIEFPDGSTIDLKPEPKAVMADYTAYMITDMLKSVISDGTGKRVNIPGLPLAGKTGTTDNDEGQANNSWFAGYTTNYSIAVWTGYDDNNRPLTGGRHYSQDLFRNMMANLSEDIETEDFVKPSSVVDVAVELGTNPPKLANEHTPNNKRVTELFVKGTEPTETSSTYKQIDPVSNLKAEYDDEADAIHVQWEYDHDDTSFEVSYKVDDEEFKSLTTTEEHHVTIEKVDHNTTYVIRVIAIDNESEKKSEDAQVSVRIVKPDDDEEEEPDEEPTEPEDMDDITVPAVSNLTASFNQSTSAIDVSWNYDGPDAYFNVNVNGHEETVRTNNLSLTGALDGETYNIVVTPISNIDETKSGEPRTTTITISIEEDPDEPHDENEDEAS